ncbi:MAG: hypothetical protein JW749_11775 [Sedimentisphaerales bacterium]|nr:hypothetical protein [Sedimentisphaerales bacterium]
MTDVNGSNKKQKSQTFVISLLLVLLLISFGFIGWQRNCGRKILINATTVQARLISEFVKSPILFDYEKGAVDILSALKESPSIIFCGVYDANDRLFAVYYRSGTQPDSFMLLKPPRAGTYTEGNLVKISQPIMTRREAVGKLWVWSEIK